MSGARGTASQQQDQRNRDNARAAGNSAPGVGGGGFGSGGFGNGRGTLSQQQDQRNMANATRAGNIAPGVGRGFASGMNNATARRTINTTPSYEMSLHNMMALSGMLPGPGMAPHVAGMMAGIGPQFTGPRGTVNGPGDYDPTNRFGSNQSQLFANQGVQGIQSAGAPKPVTPQMPGMNMMQMPAAQMNVPGPSQYGVNLPSYGYFGKPPALQRPKSAIMGGI
jgi:hypothetical protein